MERIISKSEIKKEISNVEEYIRDMEYQIVQVNNVIDSFSEAWKSNNATKVKSYIEEMSLNLTQLKNSLGGIKTKVYGFVSQAETADTANING